MVSIRKKTKKGNLTIKYISYELKLNIRGKSIKNQKTVALLNIFYYILKMLNLFEIQFIVSIFRLAIDKQGLIKKLVDDLSL